MCPLLPLLLLGPVARALTCDAYDAPVALAPMDAVASDESSGVVQSRLRPDVWFTHDDAGGEPVLFAFTLAGESRGVHEIDGASFWDWEDIAPGPCPDAPDEPCLYIADTGDNGRRRESVQIYIVHEPESDDEVLPLVATLELLWPDGAEDCEAMMVQPRTGEVWLITKDLDGVSQIARVPEGADLAPVTLEIVGTVDVLALGSKSQLMTGADWDVDGDRLIMRTYSDAYEWKTDPCEADWPWEETPSSVSLAGIRGGEAVGYDLDGGLVVTSEGAPMEAWSLACLAVGEGSGECPSEDTGDTGDSGDTSPPDSAPPDSATDSAIDSVADSAGPDTGLKISLGHVSPGDCGGCSGEAAIWPLALLGLGALKRRKAALSSRK